MLFSGGTLFLGDTYDLKASLWDFICTMLIGEGCGFLSQLNCVDIFIKLLYDVFEEIDVSYQHGLSFRSLIIVLIFGSLHLNYIILSNYTLLMWSALISQSLIYS